MEQVRLPRPMTHDLFLDALTNLDTIVDHVLISGMKGPTFYAKLVLRQGDRLIELDARPTDALSLAIRQEAPFFIDEDLLEQASYPYLFKEKRDDEELLQEFRVFLDDVVPDDFKS
ncbi:MAG: bifunctional nuclease family protein [Eggerthellaceae bacterium]|nr:bifunctional nuclease family protein [Eggerthellaceae bacterium]